MENLPNQYSSYGLPWPAQATDEDASDESVVVTPFHTHRRRANRTAARSPSGTERGISEDRSSNQSSQSEFRSHSEYEFESQYGQDATYIWRLFEETAPQPVNEFDFYRFSDNLSGAGRLSDSDSGTSGDWNYDRQTGGQRDESEWDEIDVTQEQREIPRSFWAQSFVDARSEVRKLFLYAIAVTKTDSPGLSTEAAWAALVAKFYREVVFESEQEVINAWLFAFNEPAHSHFRFIYESPVASILSLW